MTTVKSFFKTALAIAALATLTVSCNKDNEKVTPLELNKAQANSSLYVIDGQWWSPMNAANWPNIYVDLSGSGDQSTNASDIHQVIFGSHVNGNISAGSGYAIKFIDKDYSTVVASDWNSSSAISATTLGRQTTTTPPYGWYTYNTTTRANEAIAGRTILVRSDDGSEIYAVKLIEFTNVSQTGSGAGLQVKADANIAFKTL
ncbi:hypothetical protein ACFU8T_06775 [Sphingobacterium spiritivorum]|uniref:HmuY family protein n=1 Tax=Sphingobacterium spiritivorum ATCC 33861 TaxID=525373 RepID=D7VRQ1_SPHSI|nr:hypothetical protein [Sphingobacterium spiritivorum]EFK56452.1 hypothetical protein HMPREF0766_13655 [Sphingobacterium spiritivorum ATCC 33861]QQT35478.1 hypothetical protein I6J01_19720 [Sphingobacterium spiritivorum]WQD32168.1 hypothetical protein U0038_11670 [Sphingobacterium spiritivorum]SUJ06119.1 Uncharacterised protein [Sphingobacterium spiritivorum]